MKGHDETRSLEEVNMYPEEYLDYLIHFHSHRDYFECHEILEEFWKSRGKSEQVWVGLIQIAVGLYHYRRGNLAGAEKMIKNALSIIRMEEKEVETIGIDSSQLIHLLQEVITRINQKLPYTSITLPLLPDLQAKCLKLCTEKGYFWNKPSNLQNEFIINKHTLRDRSEVIDERLQAKKRSKF